MKKERCPYGNDKAERRVPTSGCRSQSNIADSLVNGLLMLLEPFAGLAHEMGVSYTGLLHGPIAGFLNVRCQKKKCLVGWIYQ